MTDATKTALVHPADRMIHAIADRTAPVCVGVDPVFERLPRSVRSIIDAPEAKVEGVDRFTDELLAAVAPHVPCVKFQSACFERYGAPGVQVLSRNIERATQLGLQVILDAKRGDIGLSNEQYAAAAFQHHEADWMTVNPYLGIESLAPFVQSGHGAFALVRTSNPESDAVQSQVLANGHTVAEAVADLVASFGEQSLGTSGYSSLGAVIGATKGEDLLRLRERMPRQILLVPGYGAQGAGVNDILELFHSDGRGAIITASRSVIYAGGEEDPHWATAVSDAAAQLADEVGRATGMRS